MTAVASTTSDIVLGGHTTLSAVAAIGNPRYPPSSSKKLVLDAQIYLGSTSEQLIGVVSYFNLSNLTFGLNDVALYHIECTFAKFDPDHIDSQPTKVSPPRYAFAGDIQKIVRLSDNQSISNGEADSSKFAIDACQQAYVHIAGAAANCNKAQGSFDIDVEHYISLTKPNHSNKVMTPISCYIPDSPRWKLAKPVPYNKRYVFVTGLLSNVSFDTSSTEPLENRPVVSFGITVDNIVFLGTHGAGSSSSTSPNVLDKTESQARNVKRLISYGKRHEPPAEMESTSVNELSPIPSATEASTSKAATSVHTTSLTSTRDSPPSKSPPSKKTKKN